MRLEDYLEISTEVKEALAKGNGVVALESTIISHGMPYPKNKEVALMCLAEVRNAGAVPAICAIINGKLKVGLTDDEVEILAREGRNVAKASRRDIPYVVSHKLNAALTVASTMILASLAGIKVFATGGIGGVHRGASETFDISADLEELAKTNVAVICAGPKAILDLAKTLEYLETKGVDVIGYKTNHLPAFYSSSSDYFVNHRYDSAAEIAETLKVKWELGLDGGVLITNPIAKEYEVPSEKMNAFIDQALKEMNNEGVNGNNVTPYLLAKIVELSGGESLEANIKLVLSNCRLASEIAKAL